MKLITLLRNKLFPVIARQNKQILILREALSTAEQKCWELADKQNKLLTEIEYLYTILVHRFGYRYYLLVFPKSSPLLFTSGKQGDKAHFILYVPSECAEIASLFTRPVGKTLVIGEVEISPAIIENKHLATVLVQQIIAEARNMGMEHIAGSSGIMAAARFSKIARIGEIIGVFVPYVAQ